MEQNQMCLYPAGGNCFRKTNKHELRRYKTNYMTTNICCFFFLQTYLQGDLYLPYIFLLQRVDLMSFLVKLS